MQNEDVIALHQVYFMEKPDLKILRGFFSVLYSTLYLTRIYRHDENSDKYTCEVLIALL